MLVIKEKLVVFSFCILIFKSNGLEKVTLKEDIILATESALKNTTRKLFSELRLRKPDLKLRQTLLVHNFFTSVTLRDHKTLNLIVKLSRVNKNDIKNETEYFIDVINDILNNDSNDDLNDSRVQYNEDLTQNVDEFLTNLKELKENTGYNNDYDNLEVKDEIIKMLRSHDPIEYNVSQTQSNMTVGTSSEEDSLSENDFWEPKPERRIYQGIKTKAKYFPFMASIHIFKGFQCAGSIVKSDLIVTAASCLQLAWNNRFFRENPAFLSVRVGSNFYTGGGEEIPILEVYFHPEYNPKSLKNNIAVLRLLRHLKFRKRKRRLRKIEIDRKESSLPLTTDGITIVGWGARGTSNIVRDPWTNRLSFAVLDVYDLQECQKIYSREYVTRTNFCAGFISKGGGACNHDVGGPGVVNGILTGVISFGSPICGAPDAPTVFTKVGFYSDWIDEIMDQDVPRSKKRTTLRYTTDFMDPIAPVFKTTHKLPPLDQINIPNSLPQEDLRNLKEEEDFKEFLSTMFDNKEIKEFRDLLNELSIDKLQDADSQSLTDETQESQNNTKDVERTIDKDVGMTDKWDQESVTEQPVKYTKMDGIETGTEKISYTVLDDRFKSYDEIAEKNIAQLIDDIDSSKADENSASSIIENKIVDETLLSPLEKNKSRTNEDEELNIMNLSESSRSEPSNDVVENISKDSNDNFSEGLPIAEDGLINLYLKHNRTRSVLDFMSRNELYDLLSEAINEVTKNKTM